MCLRLPKFILPIKRFCRHVGSQEGTIAPKKCRGGLYRTDYRRDHESMWDSARRITSKVYTIPALTDAIVDYFKKRSSAVQRKKKNNARVRFDEEERTMPFPRGTAEAPKQNRGLSQTSSRDAPF